MRDSYLGHNQHNSVIHNPRLHAARRTNNFLYCQLIPYIGNKRKLLPLIYEAITATGILEEARQAAPIFFDAFAGSGVVSRLAKTLGFRVISNDWEPYALELNTAYIAANSPPAFSKLGGMEAAFRILNNLPRVDGYFSKHYCPKDDENPDPDTERMFFTRANGAKIDAIRQQIEEWSFRNLIDRRETSVLLASLIYAVSYVSNTSGVFKGFHRGWGGKNGTALYRILSDIHLDPPVFYDNKEENIALRKDANELVKHVSAEITYVDPPYNQHQYGSNYHLLNTVALWDKPPVNPCILIDGKVNDKSAIRRDWRTERRSAYCYASSAAEAFENFIAECKSRWVLVSYSTDGIIPVQRMAEILSQYGWLTAVSRQYKRYRVSPTRPSGRGYNTEFVLILDKEKPGGSSIEDVINNIGL